MRILAHVLLVCVPLVPGCAQIPGTTQEERVQEGFAPVLTEELAIPADRYREVRRSGGDFAELAI